MVKNVNLYTPAFFRQYKKYEALSARSIYRISVQQYCIISSTKYRSTDLLSARDH